MSGKAETSKKRTLTDSEPDTDEPPKKKSKQGILTHKTVIIGQTGRRNQIE